MRVLFSASCNVGIRRAPRPCPCTRQGSPALIPRPSEDKARLAEISKGRIVSRRGGGGGCSLPASPFSNPKGSTAALHAALENVGTCAHVDLSLFAGAAVLGWCYWRGGGRMAGHEPTPSRLVKGWLAKSACLEGSRVEHLPTGNGSGRVFSRGSKIGVGLAVISRVGGEERLASPRLRAIHTAPVTQQAGSPDTRYVFLPVFLRLYGPLENMRVSVIPWGCLPSQRTWGPSTFHTTRSHVLRSLLGGFCCIRSSPRSGKSVC